jgi:hypothetical protein
MKARFVLIISVGVNLYLLSVLYSRLRQAPPPALRSDPVQVLRLVTNEFRLTKSAPVSGPASLRQRTSTVPFQWSMIEAENYETYIANLRAIGCPEKTIRDIVTAEVEATFDARWETFLDEHPLPEPNSAGRRAAEKQLNLKAEQLTRERKSLLRSLVGAENAAETDPRMFEAPGYDFDEFATATLSEAKQKQFFASRKDFEQRLAALHGRDENPSPETEIQSRALLKQWEAELAAFLAPDELAEFWTRHSAYDLELVGFGGTERQYRQLARWKRDAGTAPVNATQTLADRADPDALFDQRAREFLGDERYADFLRARNPEFHRLYEVAEDQQLPLTAAVTAFNLRLVTEQELARIRADEILTPDDRQAAVESLRRETQRALGQALGAAGYQVYANAANQWFQPDKP